MTENTKDAPNIVIFPPLASVIAPGVAVALEVALPRSFLPPAFTPWMLILGVALMVAAFALAISGVRAFKAGETNVDPRQPALNLVEAGPYRFTRNPMYLGMVTLQFGLALTFSLDWAIPAGLILWSVLHWGVVLREEAYLSAKFGQPYNDYLTRTRRWL
ncbi:methyltransferase family protein [Actibacterium mucosum]|uniref:methyltransferase family protein n=1 Tax=Actibacterium mucosum TaxID=1087332 RepID=UPI0005596ACF|nr:isoprenylcysteine carboxylmethyltransferase family protein [Actibacterium mucosum]